MSEPRPVPRRESPWGTPEGEHRQPKPHRCNDRAEDVIQAFFEGNPFNTVPGPFKLFWQCMRSKPGEEPTEPFTYLELDPPKREVELEKNNVALRAGGPLQWILPLQLGCTSTMSKRRRFFRKCCVKENAALLLK